MRRIRAEEGVCMADRSRDKIWEIARRQSAYDCSCAPEDFLAEENRVFESYNNEKARKYLELPHICHLVSYGSNVVVSGQAALLPEIERILADRSDFWQCFEPRSIYRLNQVLAKVDARMCFLSEYFLPDKEEIFRWQDICACELRMLEPADFAGLYLPKWQNALCEDRKHLDRLAVGAYERGNLVGLAGCSADCDTMWQIGVDVLPEYRRRGIACALTNRLARETFERGLIPFYSISWANIRSMKNAVRSGFRPGWVEAAAKGNSFFA